MRILFTNDDGVFSPGLLALLSAFQGDGNELLVAAPDAERSGASHSFTMLSPLRAKPVMIPGAERVAAYAVSGTPVDCVKLAYGNLFEKPDLLISVSNIAWKPGSFEAATAGAKFAAEILRREPSIRLLNVNAPDLALAQVRGVRITPAGVQEYEARYEERIDPYGQKYYWIPTGRMNPCGPESDCDERWTNDGYIAITPLVTNMTDYPSLERLRAMQDEITLDS